MSGLLSEDWDAYSEGALSEHLAVMAEQFERMHAAVLGCAERVGRSQVVGRSTRRPAPQTWLVAHCAMTRPTATRLVRTARHLRGNEHTAKALGRG